MNSIDSLSLPSDYGKYDDDVMVVGPGARFLSGIGYHTASMVNAFAKCGHSVSALLIRDLCPRWLYPGRDRIGNHGIDVLRLAEVPISESLDWYWGPSILRSIAFLRSRRPRVVILQWWTAVTAHTYLLLALLGRLQGASVVIEMHEITDVGEASIPFVSAYAKGMMRLIARLTNGVVVHSNTDIGTMQTAYPTLAQLPVSVVFPGPLKHSEHREHVTSTVEGGGTGSEITRFLFFGIIRSYKGIDELAAAFTSLVDDGEAVHLTVAGEAWADAEAALSVIRKVESRHYRIVSGYIPDEEVTQLFESTDIVVAPYRRASASGPVNLTMEAGLPLVTTRVPALEEACRDYRGVLFAAVEDPDDLRAVMKRAMGMVGSRFHNPHGWDANATEYFEFFDRLMTRDIDSSDLTASRTT
ncbi:glycosyltransferase family 4 protein [Mycolicibacterium arenosum]|uniref:Glycosyltransferase family 4 protein n=1 Tax=Mycolicibacterium arenosum TaxID=2952157 RepID=A0ABT1M9P8_9MYCO|nr:glycosyltransferase family 4 protein [Mycolicibacterium sp. CAU 1645]MCP9275280.1 glycosyltransferase family 4 protein [Mycolicibacterium sp. CAU 1645]